MSRIALIYILLLPSTAMLLAGCSGKGEPLQPLVVAPPPSPSPPSPLKDYSQDLMDAGWNNAGAAKAVADLNAEWFSIMAEENPKGLSVQLTYLKSLKEFPVVFDLLQKHPETAGLLSKLKDPTTVGKILEMAGAEFENIAGLFLQNCEPEKAQRLGEAIERHQKLIMELRSLGFLGTEEYFMFDRKKGKTEEYDLWLSENFDSRKADGEETSIFITLLSLKGKWIRDKMAEDEAFRRNFRTELWPKFVNSIQKENSMGLITMISNDKIWDLLATEQGESLLKISGALAVDLLYGDTGIKVRGYPGKYHKRISEILIEGKAEPIMALLEFRDEQLFLNFLGRNLKPAVEEAAMAQLLKDRPNHKKTLSYFANLQPADLEKDLAPCPTGLITWLPFYETVYVLDKIISGRKVSGMEAFCASIDPAFLVIDLLLPTGVPKKTIVKAGQDAVKEALENTVKVLGPQAIKEMPKEQLGGWVAVSTLKESSAGIKEMFKQAARPTDITKLIQLSQTMSGNPSSLFESGASLMAKKDGGIFIAIPDSKKIPAFLGKKGVAFFKQTGENLVVGVIVESEPGQAGLREAGKQARVVNDQILAWKKNVSAWWLADHQADLRQAAAGGNP